MDYQEALENLSALEEFFFYRKSDPGSNAEFSQEMKELHKEIRSALERFHKLTGLTLNRPA